MQTTTRAFRRSTKRRSRRSWPTLGPQVCAWIERNLVHGEGDYFGKPFVLRPWQRAIVWQAYEVHRDGSRRYNRVLLGLPKGNGKTELAAALGCAELAGPVVCAGWDAGRPIGNRRTAPVIPVAAASFDQANLLFGSARTMIREGRLRNHFEAWETEILLKHSVGRMYRVAAVAGTNDGVRPTFFLGDELHEWVGNKERVHLVLSNGRAKRADAWELAISTAGWDTTSLLGRLYQHGRRVAARDEQDESFLFVWWEPRDGEVDLGDEHALTQALQEANPAAGDFLPLANLLQKAREMPEHEFRRYHLNQWTSAPERWLPAGVWEALVDPKRQVPDGEEVYLGFDGSFSGDSTAIVGCTRDRHLFVVAVWEKPAGAADDWYVNPSEVEAAILQAAARWQVRRIGCDPHRWQRSMAVLDDAGLPIIKWPSHSVPIMVAGTQQFQEAAFAKHLTHDGDRRLAHHVSHCIVKTDARGPRITKEYRDSPRRIDVAVAAVIAHDLANRDQHSAGWVPV